MVTGSKLRGLAIGLAVGALAVGASAERASAYPLLQLDIASDMTSYQATTETIISTSDPMFTVVALGTPGSGDAGMGGKQTKSESYFTTDSTFYLSASVLATAFGPGVSDTNTDWGYFSVTDDLTGTTHSYGNCGTCIAMRYGYGPIESALINQGHDGGDLPPHGVYPTQFIEITSDGSGNPVGFQFDTGHEVDTYNTADNPGAANVGDPADTGDDVLDGDTNTQYSLYRTFTIDISGLNDPYQVHFDLYDKQVLDCSKKKDPPNSCTDTDVGIFAPFSHDAQSWPVPEPTTIGLFGMGLLGLGMFGRRQRKRAA